MASRHGAQWPTGTWPDVDPRFQIMPQHRFGPFYSVRIVDEQTGPEVSVEGGTFLTGRASVYRAAKHSTARYLKTGGRRERRR